MSTSDCGFAPAGQEFMARSSYIYLVTEGGVPTAAFTVKWEMEQWITQHPSTYQRFRMADGLHPTTKEPVEMVDD